MIQRRFNYKFGEKRSETKKYKELLTLRKMLPACIDLRRFCSPVENQGLEGSCSGHAAAGAVEFLELMELRLKAMQGPLVYQSDFVKVSRNFIYYGERAIEGTQDLDSGVTTLLDACSVLTQQGVCRESLWPYDPNNVFLRPSDEAFQDASLHKVPSYYSLDRGYQLKHCLWSGFPFMLGFQVFESFMSQQVSLTGVMPMPEAGEKVIGGHAVLAVGYDDARDCFIIKNSWGNAWGIDGYFHMPYEFVNSLMADDFYTLRLSPMVNP